MGQKLWQLTLSPAPGAAGHQVLCVTHLPQLAGFGDRHLRVEKVVRGGRTVTRVTALEEAARVEELAQMLGGGGDAHRESARAILDQVRRAKAPQVVGWSDSRVVLGPQSSVRR
ncbi:MAG: hypothetical protein D6759_04260 [Chloroflexi bacterium]|nr:MAG: hypothetical protein D6759_04260 [Chloroflexota bacterium]